MENSPIHRSTLFVLLAFEMMKSHFNADVVLLNLNIIIITPHSQLINHKKSANPIKKLKCIMNILLVSQFQNKYIKETQILEMLIKINLSLVIGCIHVHVYLYSYYICVNII
jgi:hypothetical protein